MWNRRNEEIRGKVRTNRSQTAAHEASCYSGLLNSNLIGETEYKDTLNMTEKNEEICTKARTNRSKSVPPSPEFEIDNLQTVTRHEDNCNSGNLNENLSGQTECKDTLRLAGSAITSWDVIKHKPTQETPKDNQKPDNTSDEQQQNCEIYLGVRDTSTGRIRKTASDDVPPDCGDDTVDETEDEPLEAKPMERSMYTLRKGKKKYMTKRSDIVKHIPEKSKSSDTNDTNNTSMSTCVNLNLSGDTNTQRAMGDFLNNTEQLELCNIKVEITSDDDPENMVYTGGDQDFHLKKHASLDSCYESLSSDSLRCTPEGTPSNGNLLMPSSCSVVREICPPELVRTVSNSALSDDTVLSPRESIVSEDYFDDDNDETVNICNNKEEIIDETICDGSIEMAEKQESLSGNCEY